MIRAKVLAMCVCPVVAAPPTLLALHPPARHAVAHMLHRAARRLDHEPTPAPLAAAVPLPCAPSLASADGELPVVGGALIGGNNEVGPLAFANNSPSTGIGGGYGGGGFFGGGSGGSGVGGGGGGTSGTGPSVVPTGVTPVGVTPVVGVPFTPPGALPIGAPVQVSGAPEPATWLFLVVGFGLVGAITRSGRTRHNNQPAVHAV